MEKELVSIIVPVYNAEKFLKDTIESVINQTYKNWELVLVNDCSTDNSENIIKEYVKTDSRIKLLKNGRNSGAAISRNNGVDIAEGRYICYIDADDKWEKEKIAKQVKFMTDTNCSFSFTSYEFADENCLPNGKKVIVPKTITYEQALKNTTIWTSTVMLDMKTFKKSEIHMPKIKSEDTALWWKILRKGTIAYGIKDVLSYYRRTSGTLSSNKIEAIKRIWNLYRNSEELNIFYSIYNFCFWAFNAVRRRI